MILTWKDVAGVVLMTVIGVNVRTLFKRATSEGHRVMLTHNCSALYTLRRRAHCRTHTVDDFPGLNAGVFVLVFLHVLASFKKRERNGMILVKGCKLPVTRLNRFSG